MRIKLLSIFVFSFILSNAQSLLPTYSISTAGSADAFKGGYTFAYATSGTPWNGALMSFGGFENSYDCQLSTDYGPSGGNRISFRTRNGDASTWNAWNELATKGSNQFTGNQTIMGNVGIGTANPQAKLDVNGIIRTGAGGWLEGGIQMPFSNHGSSRSWWLSSDVNSWGDFAIQQSTTQTGTAYNTLLEISNTGNVGIGTTTPQAKLDVGGNLLLRNYTNTVGAGASLLFSSYSSDSPGARIRSSLYFANESTSRSSLILSSYWEGYKDELTLMNGNVGIGTASPRYNLDVAGNSSFGGNMRVDANIQAKEVKVILTPTADFVFAQDYALPKLEDVEKFVTENKHLPEVASAEEMKKEGVNIGEFQIKLLQKIEELTLYSIEQNNKNKAQEERLKAQNDKIENLEKLVQKLISTQKK